MMTLASTTADCAAKEVNCRRHPRVDPVAFERGEDGAAELERAVGGCGEVLGRFQGQHVGTLAKGDARATHGQERRVIPCRRHGGIGHRLLVGQHVVTFFGLQDARKFGADSAAGADRQFFERRRCFRGRIGILRAARVDAVYSGHRGSAFPRRLGVDTEAVGRFSEKSTTNFRPGMWCSPWSAWMRVSQARRPRYAR